ncbi:putative inactive shikimate kinase like 1, chloroplastic [Sesamum angolense]|uniref:Inactive shikimate kinase like 1, chloroplastic n=1 Tax=Sesamum angolense TaxID=2727404 RepID=A0AAE2BPH5_9LAMI|nr:putative inactive shikimate kinase like 1, chloroplastic [Sesamum angolense]
MDIIQASRSCSSPAWNHPSFAYPISAPTRVYPPLFPTSIFSLKPKLSARRKLVSTATCAILENSTSGINNSYKLSLGRILADALRYYYFDSDSLVEEAYGGKTAAISYIERDEEGYLASEVLAQLTAVYNSARSGYSTADATISLQKVASQLGYDELDAVTSEDLCMEVLKEVGRLMRVKKMMEEAARPF